MLAVDRGTSKMIKFSIGDMIRDVDGIQYKIEKDIGGKGSQNMGVYIVRSHDGNPHVLKILINAPRGMEKGPLTRKWDNIKLLVGNRKLNVILGRVDDNGSFTMPKNLYDCIEAIGSVNFILKGYIMDFAEGDVLTKAPFDYPLEKKLLICKRLAGLMRRLQGLGCNFKDLSFGNIICNTRNGTVAIIDCDNIQLNSNRKGSETIDLNALGTEWNIAPELVYNKKSIHNKNTDSYSLACIMFYYLVSGFKNDSGDLKVIHQYDGAIFRDTCMKIGGCLNMCELRDSCEREGIKDSSECLRFIFDQNGGNHLPSLIKEMNLKLKGISDLPFDESEKKTIAENIGRDIKQMEEMVSKWNSLDGYVRQLFLEAFCEPFETRRPSALAWEHVLTGLVKQSSISLPFSKESTGEGKTEKAADKRMLYFTFNDITKPISDNAIRRKDLGFPGDHVSLHVHIEDGKLIILNKDPILSFIAGDKTTLNSNQKIVVDSNNIVLKNGIIGSPIAIDWR